MRKEFKTYYYVGEENNQYKGKNDYAFDENYFNTLINNQQYKDAATYAGHYYFKDLSKQLEHQTRIVQLETQGNIVSSIYSNAESSGYGDAIKFSNGFNGNTLDDLEENGNKFAKVYLDAKRNLGRVDYADEHGNMTYDRGTNFAITFYPKSRTLFGIDWLAKDNEDSIEDFYRRSGLSKERLQKAGVSINESNDGKTIIKFHQSNDLADVIWNNIPSYSTKGEPALLTRMPTSDKIVTKHNLPSFLHQPNKKRNIQHRDWIPEESGWSLIGGNKIESGPSSGVDIESFDDAGNIVQNARTFNYDLLNRLQRIKQDADNEVNKFYNTVNKTNPKANTSQSTILCGYISNRYAKLKQMLEQGRIKPSDFNVYKREIMDEYDRQVRALASSNKTMYSNWDDDGVETLKELDTKNRKEVIDYISSQLNSNRVTYQAAINGDLIGTMITVDAIEDKEHDIIKPRIQVFVPGLFAKNAQKRIAENTTYRAINELNNITTWGYNYKTNDGKIISRDVSINDGQDRFIVEDANTGEKEFGVDKQRALTYMDKSMSMQEIARSLLAKHINSKGNFYDEGTFKNEARTYATAIVNTLYPELKMLTPDDIFKNPISDDNGNEIKYDNIHYATYAKIKEAYSIYDYICNFVKNNIQ